jgi:hypothetical protein
MYSQLRHFTGSWGDTMKVWEYSPPGHPLCGVHPELGTRRIQATLSWVSLRGEGAHRSGNRYQDIYQIQGG